MPFNFKDSTLHHTASFDSATLSLAGMASSSRSKASTKGRPQPKHGKKTAVRPSRLLTRRRPTCRATSPESIGEQIEVQLERHFTFQAHPSPGESSVGSHPPSPALSHVSYVSHADLSVHSPLSNHSSPSRAHNEGRPSPAGSGSVYEASREPPEGFTDINSAALKALLDAHITPFTQLPEMLFLQIPPWPGTWSRLWPYGQPSSRRRLAPRRVRLPSVWAMPFHPLNIDKDPKILFTHQTIYPRSELDINSRPLTFPSLSHFLPTYRSPNEPETFYIHPRPSRFPGPKGTITTSTTHHHPLHDGNNGMSYEADEVARCIRDGKIESERMPWEESRVVQGWADKVRKEKCEKKVTV
ncbi:hypothetical protein C348_02283 [Cryptococcus neoformans Gb118]|nr:hypothetical protein C348_02283 [Cryptococcus neoformans var. grubii Gb118]